MCILAIRLSSEDDKWCAGRHLFEKCRSQVNHKLPEILLICADNLLCVIFKTMAVFVCSEVTVIMISDCTASPRCLYTDTDDTHSNSESSAVFIRNRLFIVEDPEMVCIRPFRGQICKNNIHK